MNKKSNQLSDENIKILELWETGQSATEIGRQFNITRNSVIGRVYRARQSGVEMARYKSIKSVPKSPPAKKGSKRYIEIKAKDKYKTPPTPPLSPTPSNNNKIKPVNFLDLEPWSCRYIVNEDKTNPFFCGAPKEIRSYCKIHADLCYVPSTWRKKWPIELSALGGIILTGG